MAEPVGVRSARITSSGAIKAAWVLGLLGLLGAASYSVSLLSTNKSGKTVKTAGENSQAIFAGDNSTIHINNLSNPLVGNVIGEDRTAPQSANVEAVVRGQAPDDDAAPLSTSDAKIASRQSTASNPSPLKKIQEVLPPILFGDTIEELRAKLMTSPLLPIEDDKSLARLRNGCYGYGYQKALPKSPATNFDRTLRNIKLHQDPRLIYFLEIHKLSDGHIYVIGYVSPQTFVRISDSVASEHADRIDEIIYVRPQVKDRTSVAAIPIQRLIRWEIQNTKDFGPVADVTMLTK